MCTLCGFSSSDFWADFALDASGALSPSAVRPRQASLLGRWAAVAGRAEGHQVLDLTQEAPQAPVSGLFSGAWIKASVRGFTVSSPTGAMRFCSSLRTVVEQMRAQRPVLAGRLHCALAPDSGAVDWAVLGAAWAWNAFMNDDHAPLPRQISLLDGRGLKLDPAGDDRLYVTVIEADALAAVAA